MALLEYFKKKKNCEEIIAWDISVFGVFWSLFSPNAGKCGLGKLRIQTLFTPWRTCGKSSFITAFLDIYSKVHKPPLYYLRTLRHDLLWNFFKSSTLQNTWEQVLTAKYLWTNAHCKTPVNKCSPRNGCEQVLTANTAKHLWTSAQRETPVDKCLPQNACEQVLTAKRLWTSAHCKTLVNKSSPQNTYEQVLTVKHLWTAAQRKTPVNKCSSKNTCE